MAVVISTIGSDSFGEAVRQRATAEGVTVSTLVRRLLKEYLERHAEGEFVDAA